MGAGTGQSIAIGNSAVTTGDQATALGNNVKASGNSSVAIGGDDIDKVVDASADEYNKLTGGTIVKGNDKANGGSYTSTESKGGASVAIGVQTVATGNFSTAIGMTSNSWGSGSVAIGARAEGLDKGATSIGTASQATKQQATAIGMNSTATAKNATAIGSGGSSRDKATAATAEGAIAIGGDSVAGARATGKNAIALGGQSTATKENAVAIGMGASSTHGNSVALGTGSVATGGSIGNAAWQPKDAAGNPIAVAGTATGEVSIGKAGSERRITNMAAGSADTDGVNVSQLKALDNALTSNVTSLKSSITNLEKGWNIQSDNDTATAVKASDTVQFNSGKNIDVARTGNVITVNTAQDMTLNSVSFSDTAGNNSVLSASGLKVSNAAGSSAHYGSEQLVFNQGTANAVSIGNTGINAGNQKITKVAEGALSSTSKDAVNGSQLHKTNQDLTQVSNQVTQNTGDIANLSQGWKLQSDNDTASAVKAGDTVQFNSGKNIDVSRDGNTLTIATADDLDLNSVNLQDASGQTLTTLDASGLNVSNADNSLTTNVGAGIINVGGNTHTIAIDGNTGEITGLSNTKYDPSSIQADRAATEGQIADLDQQLTNKGFNISAQGGAGDTVKLGETVNFSNTDGNIEISNSIDNGIQFKLANAISVQRVTVTDALGNNANYGANGISISSAAGNTITIADNKVNFGGNTLSGIGAGVNPDDAVNKGQLDNLGNNLADNIFGGNATYDGNTITWSNIGGTGANTVDSAISSVNDKVNLGWNAADTAGNTFNVAAGQTVGFMNTDGNIDIAAAGSSLTFALGKDIKVNSVTAGDTLGNVSVMGSGGTTVTDAVGNNANYGANGISISSAAGNTITIADNKVNFGGNTLSGIGAGVNPDDAVNKGQLDNLGNNLADNIFGGNATYDGNTITWSNIGGTGANTVDSAISSVNNKVNLGWNVSTNGDTASNVAPGATVDFANKDGNVQISNTGGNITVDLSKNLKVDEITADKVTVNEITAGGNKLDKNGLTVGDTTITTDGITIDGGPSMTKNGIDAGGKVITNVADGVLASDAVNKGQMDQAIKDSNAVISKDITEIKDGIGNVDDLFDTFDVSGQTTTDRKNLVDTINAINTTGVKYAHTNDGGDASKIGTTNDSSAGGKNSSAFGVGAIVEAGADSSVAMGHNTFVSSNATNAVAIGSGSKAMGESAIALGHGSEASGKQSISIGTGNKVTGNHSGAIGDPNTVSGNESYALGNNNTISADKSFVVGNNVSIDAKASDMSASNGASFNGSVALGNGSTVSAPVGTASTTIQGTKYDFAGSKPVGTVSVGSAGGERTVTNVAAGQISSTSTDAINGSQLYATNKAIENIKTGGAGVVQYSDAATPNKSNGGKPSNNATLVGADVNAPVTLSNVADGKAPNDAVNVKQMQQMSAGLNSRIDSVEDNADAGTATAMAVAGLPQAYTPGKSMVAISGGVYRGQSGYAVGYSTISEGGNWVIKAAASGNSQGYFGGTAGVGYQW